MNRSKKKNRLTHGQHLAGLTPAPKGGDPRGGKRKKPAGNSWLVLVREGSSTRGPPEREVIQREKKRKICGGGGGKNLSAEKGSKNSN